MIDEKWFPRFASIPGIQYESPPDVNFSYLPGYGSTPEIKYYYSNGKKSQRLIVWNNADGSTSSSPATQWKTTPLPGESKAATLLRQIFEVLELPGTLSDYHFALQNTHEEVKKHIGNEIWILPAIEKLCWLNIRLIELYPETIFFETERGSGYFRAFAFPRLINLYKKEGNLIEALQVAKIASRFDYGDEFVKDLEERIKVQKKEDEYV